MRIIAVDWGKHASKRSAYEADSDMRTVRKLDFDGSLQNLMVVISEIPAKVLIGIDAAIGLPKKIWDAIQSDSRIEQNNFADFLLRNELPNAFFSPITDLQDWTPNTPFIRPPKGKWSLKEYEVTSGDTLYRAIDKQFRANSLFVVSGLPGSVGSGTIALWKELITLAKQTQFNLWPFDGHLADLLETSRPTIGEIYPKACYGIALSDEIPSPLITIGKRNANTRKAVIQKLAGSAWIGDQNVRFSGLANGVNNEDDFDALISVAALLRLVLCERPLEGSQNEWTTAEGDILGGSNVTQQTTIFNQSVRKSQRPAIKTETTYHCPIPGCSKTFNNTRSGWDAHVASLKQHPNWHPDIHAPNERKAFFKREFKDWFD